MKALIPCMAIFLSFAAHANDLPCPIDEALLWDNCTGTFTYKSGDKFVGEFRDDKMEGLGTFTWANGNRHVCNYKKGMQQGHGTYILADGTAFIVKNRHGMPHLKRLHSMTEKMDEKHVGIKQ